VLFLASFLFFASAVHASSSRLSSNRQCHIKRRRHRCIGGVIADAELTLTNQATGFEQRVTSNERGEYTFRNLTPGTYDLKVTKSGFENYIQTRIVLTINQSGHADASLKVGATNQTVTVEGENTLINFDNGTLQGGIDPDTLKELPLSFAGKPRSSQVLRSFCRVYQLAAAARHSTRASMEAYNPAMRRFWTAQPCKRAS